MRSLVRLGRGEVTANAYLLALCSFYNPRGTTIYKPNDGEIRVDEQNTKISLRDVFSPTFLAVSLINFAVMTGYYTVFVSCTGYCSAELKTSLSTAGLITGIVVIGCLIGRFFTGKIVHSAGYKRILFLGLSLYLITNLAYLYTKDPLGFFIIRFLSGAAVGIVGTVTGTLVALVTPKPYLARGIAYFSLSTALALCFGPFLGIALLPMIGYAGLFWTASALSLGALCLILLITVSEQVRKEKTKQPLSIKLSDFIDVKLVPFCSVIALFCVAWGNVQAFMGPYSEQFGLHEAASFFFIVYAVSIMVTRPYCGKICDLHGPALVFYPAILSLTLGLALLYFYPTSWSVLVSGALIGFGFGNIQSVGQASAVSLVPRERYAQATSTFYIFFDLGIGIAPYLSGYLVPSIGYTGVYGVTAILTILSLPLYYLATKDRTNPSLGVRLKFKSDKESK